jgi:hypothetical protein
VLTILAFGIAVTGEVLLGVFDLMGVLYERCTPIFPDAVLKKVVPVLLLVAISLPVLLGFIIFWVGEWILQKTGLRVWKRL